MKTPRFDSVSRQLVESPISRRTILKQGSAGLAAVAGLGLASHAIAQDSTPEATPTVDPNDPHPSADDVPIDLPFLFVQPFEGGTWAPKDGEEDVYTLTLSGAAAQTVYFSDRPGRIVGLAPTELFLEGLGFTPENPPNAALVAENDSGEQEILVIELIDPVYDPEAGTLTYDAMVLADYTGPGLAHLAVQQTDFDHPESFGEGSLFIDDCPDGSIRCSYQGPEIRSADFGRFINGQGYCWNWGVFACRPCWPDAYAQQCNATFPDYCQNNCRAEAV